jgi:hypothetical protein
MKYYKITVSTGHKGEDSVSFHKLKDKNKDKIYEILDNLAFENGKKWYNTHCNMYSTDEEIEEYWRNIDSSLIEFSSKEQFIIEQEKFLK